MANCKYARIKMKETGEWNTVSVDDIHHFSQKFKKDKFYRLISSGKKISISFLGVSVAFSQESVEISSIDEIVRNKRQKTFPVAKMASASDFTEEEHSQHPDTSKSFLKSSSSTWQVDLITRMTSLKSQHAKKHQEFLSEDDLVQRRIKSKVSMLEKTSSESEKEISSEDENSMNHINRLPTEKNKKRKDEEHVEEDDAELSSFLQNSPSSLCSVNDESKLAMNRCESTELTRKNRSGKRSMSDTEEHLKTKKMCLGSNHLAKRVEIVIAAELPKSPLSNTCPSGTNLQQPTVDLTSQLSHHSPDSKFKHGKSSKDHISKTPDSNHDEQSRVNSLEEECDKDTSSDQDKVSSRANLRTVDENLASSTDGIPSPSLSTSKNPTLSEPEQDVSFEQPQDPFPSPSKKERQRRKSEKLKSKKKHHPKRHDDTHIKMMKTIQVLESQVRDLKVELAQCYESVAGGLDILIKNWQQMKDGVCQEPVMNIPDHEKPPGYWKISEDGTEIMHAGQGIWIKKDDYAKAATSCSVGAFVKNMGPIIFGPDMRKKSVTGSIAPRTGCAKEALDANGMLAMRDIFKFYLKTHRKWTDNKEILDQLDSIDVYLRDKISDLAKNERGGTKKGEDKSKQTPNTKKPRAKKLKSCLKSSKRKKRGKRVEEKRGRKPMSSSSGSEDRSSIESNLSSSSESNEENSE